MNLIYGIDGFQRDREEGDTGGGAGFALAETRRTGGQARGKEEVQTGRQGDRGALRVRDRVQEEAVPGNVELVAQVCPLRECFVT